MFKLIVLLMFTTVANAQLFEPDNPQTCATGDLIIQTGSGPIWGCQAGSSYATSSHTHTFTAAGDTGSNQTITESGDTFTLEGGAGIATVGAATDKVQIKTASQEAGFIADGNTTNLTCSSAADAGKTQVMDDGSIQYCDGLGTLVKNYNIVNVKSYGVDCTGATVNDTELQNAATAAANGTLFVPPNCTILLQGPSSAGCAITLAANSGLVGSGDTSQLKLAARKCTNGTDTDGTHKHTNGAACAGAYATYCGGTGGTCSYDGNAVRGFADSANEVVCAATGILSSSAVSNISVNAQGTSAYGLCSVGSQACYTSSVCPSGTCTLEGAIPIGTNGINIIDQASNLGGYFNIDNVNVYDHRKGTATFRVGGLLSARVNSCQNVNTLITAAAGRPTVYNNVDDGIVALGTAIANIHQNYIQGTVNGILATGTTFISHNKVTVPVTSASATARGTGVNSASAVSQISDNNISCSAWGYGVQLAGSGQHAILHHNNIDHCFNGIRVSCQAGNVNIDHNRIQFGVGAKLLLCSYGNLVRGNYLAWASGTTGSTPNGKTCKGGRSNREICTADADCTAFGGTGATCELEPVVWMGEDNLVANVAAGAVGSVMGHVAFTGNLIHTDQAGVTGIRFADVSTRCSVVNNTAGDSGNVLGIRCTGTGICGSGACVSGLCTTGGAACCAGNGQTGTCTVPAAHDTAKIAENIFLAVATGIDASLSSGNTAVTRASWDENEFVDQTTGILLPATQITTNNPTGVVRNSYISNNACLGTTLNTCVKNYQRSMGVLKDNLPNQPDNPIIADRRQWVLQQRDQIGTNPTTAVFDAFGIDSAVLTVTNSNGTGPLDLIETVSGIDYNYVDYRTLATNTSSSFAGWISARFTLTRLNQLPIFNAVIRTGTLGSGSTGSRTYVGLVDSDPKEAAGTTKGVFLRYDTNTGIDTSAFWRCVATDGTGTYASRGVTVSQVGIADATRYVIRLDYDGLNARYYINGELACVVPVASILVSTTQALGFVTETRTLTTTARDIYISKVSMEHN